MRIPETRDGGPTSRLAGAYLLAAVPVLLWGSSFVAVKVALRTVSPFAVLAARAALGWIAIEIGARLLHRSGPGTSRPGDRRVLVLLGFLGIPVQLGLQAIALTRTSAVHSGWLVALIPVFTAVLAATFLGERMGRARVLGTILGFGGALTIVGLVSGPGALRLPAAWADLMVLATALNWAVYTLAARPLLARRTPLAVSRGTIALGSAPTLAVFALVGRPTELVRAGASTWGALAFLGIGCTGLGYLCWCAALERLEASSLTSVQYFQPLVTAAAASLWLGERVGPAVFAGGALVLAGVWLVQRGRGAPTARGGRPE